MYNIEKEPCNIEDIDITYMVRTTYNLDNIDRGLHVHVALIDTHTEKTEFTIIDYSAVLYSLPLLMFFGTCASYATLS